jgi:hypothetical protein
VRLAWFALLQACGGEDRPGAYGSLDAAVPGDAGRDAAADAAPAADAGDPPLPEPDIEFVLPYLAPARIADIEYVADVRMLDLHLTVDTTGSMSEEIDEIQSELSTTVAAGVAEAVDDVTFGVSHFQDFPFVPFGGPDDVPYELLQEQSDSLAAAQAAVRRLDDPLGFGGDFPESTAEALFQIATGEGLEVAGEELIDEHLPAAELRGGASFRPGALPVVVVVTDARSHDAWEYASAFEGAHSLAEATEALVELGARVVGVASGDDARATLVAAALETGGTMAPQDGACPTGMGGSDEAPIDGTCPLVFEVDHEGSGLSDSVVDAIRSLVESIVWRTVAIRILDDDLGFVVRAETLTAVPPDGLPAPGRADLDPADGIRETFTDVYRGTRLTYRITARNTRIEPADYEQVFFLRSQLVADGETVVGERLIRVTVPAGDAGWFDAGPDGGALDAGA